MVLAAYAGRLFLLRRGGIQWMRLSALRLPSFKGGTKGFLTVAWRSSDAKAHRENGEDLSAPAQMGEGDRPKGGGGGV